VAFLIVTPAARGSSAGQQDRTSHGPHPIRTTDRHATVVGLIYCAEVLAALAAQPPHGNVPPRITEAIRQRTPIVVMWRIPGIAGADPIPGPYQVSIVERIEHATGNPNRIDPVWIQQGASDFPHLPRGTRAEDVGAIVAFPLAAFVPGRKVVIHAQLPPAADGGARSSERFGWVEWDPVQEPRR
jgi:hypothetical protein